jgi:hypothetical protein
LDIDARVALGTDLSPQRGSRVLSRIPPLLQIGNVRVDLAWAGTGRQLRKVLRVQIFQDGAFRHAELVRNLAGGDALVCQPQYLLVALMAHATTLLRAVVFSRRAVRRADWGFRRDQRPRGLSQAGMVPEQTALQHLSGIDQQVKVVGDLLSLGCGEARRCRIVTAAVTADVAHFGMLA